MAKNKKQTEQKQVKQQKQPTIKEQVYSSIANAHVQQAMKNAGIPTAQERMESDYNKWQAMQKYEADYNAWAKSQQPKKKASSIPTVEPVKFLTAQERKALKEEQQIGKNAPYDPEKTYAKLYGNDKKHYSHQSYFRGDPETEQREKERHNQLVKEQERKQIASNVAQLPKKSYMDMYTEQTLKRSDQDKAVREVNRKKTADKLTSSMLDVTGANQKKDTGLTMPSYHAKQISKTEKDNRTVDEKISTWLDPSYKMTKSEEKEAKAIAEEGLKQFKFSGKKYKDLSAEEKALYDQYLLLDKKTSNAAAFFENAKNAVRKAGNSLSDLWLTINQANAPTSEALNTQREVIAKNKERIQKQNEEISPLIQSLQTQSPVASGAGTFAGNAGMYYLTGPIIEGLGAAASISSPVGKFVFNQIAQLGQDVLLDYKPTIDEFLADGNISDDEWKQLAINLGIGEAANIVPGIPSLVGDLKTAKNAANSFSEIDALVNNATRQANDAAANIENLSRQIPVVEENPVDSINDQFRDIMRQYNAEAPSMRDVYSAGDLEGSLNRQLSEAMQNKNVFPGGKSMAEVNADRDALIKQIDDYENNKLLQTDYIRLGRTPDYMKAYGDVSNPFVMKQSTINKIAYPEGYMNGKHNLGFESISEIPNRLNNPAAVMDSLTQPNSGVALTDMLLGDRPVIAPIHMDKPSPMGKINELASLHDRNLDNIGHMLETTNKPFINQEKVRDVLSGNGLQLSELKATTDPLLNHNLSNVVENVNKNTVNTLGKNKLVLPEDVQEMLTSDFQDMYRMLDDMQEAAEATGNAKVMEKFERLQNSMFDFENKAWKAESLEEVNKAKKAADASRQAFVREMKKVDPNYRAELTGTRIGQAEYRRSSMKLKQEEAEDLAKSFMDSENELSGAAKTQQPKKKLTIEEVHGRNGKSRYYVAEQLDNGMIQNVEPGKTYKSIDEANEAVYKLQNEGTNGTSSGMGRYNLQHFAEGNNADEWKTSKWRTNTAENTGKINNPDDIPKSDYDYRVYHEWEQQAEAEARKQSYEDLIYKDEFDAADIKAGMNMWQNLMDAGDKESLRKANRLGKKISFEARESGRIPQALAEYSRSTPEGQVRFAQDAIDDLVDKKTGAGTSEALDGLVEKVNKAYDKSKGNKEAFAKEVEKLFDENLRNYAGGKAAKEMSPKVIKGKNAVLKMIEKGADIDDITQVIYKQNGGVKLTPDEQKKIYDYLVEAQKLPEGSYEQEALLSKAAKVALAKAPSTLGQKIRSILYNNMLGNFKTALSRNAFGNAAYQTLEQGRQPIAAAVDWATSKVTKKHSALGWNKAKAGSYVQGLKEGTVDQVKDMVKGLDTGRSGAKGWELALANNATTWNDTKAIGKFANKVEYYVRNAMELGDRPFYEANYKQAYTELQQLVERYGKEGVAGLEGIKDKDLPAVIDMIASVRAADSVFQKHGHMSKGLTDIRNGLGEMSRAAIGVDVLSTAASAFTMTPGNMIERAIEYTPLGFIKNTVQTIGEVAGKQGFNQRRFVDQASRSIAGLPILGGAYALAKSKDADENDEVANWIENHIGSINGGYSSDPDEKAAQQEDGYIEYGYNVPEWMPGYGGKTLDTSDLPVLGPSMQAGAVMSEQGITPRSSLQAAEAILGGSTTQGIRRAFGADSPSYSSSGKLSGVVDNFINTVLSSGSQLIPSLARQTAQTIDPYKRDLGEYGTMEYYWNLMKNNDPIGRRTLPIKTNVEGEPVLQNQGRSLGNKILENYFLPMNVSEYNPSPLNQEASRLYKETGSAIGFAPKATRKDLRDWDKKAGTEFTEEQFREYKSDFGKMNSELGHALIESEYYKSLNPEQQNKALQDLYSGMKQVARYNTTGLETDNKIANAYIDNQNSDSVIKYMEAKGIADSSGLNANSKAYKEVMNKVLDGDSETAHELIEENNKANDLYAKYNLTEDENAATVYNKAGESGLNYYSQLKKKGLNDYRAAVVYNNATKEITNKSELPTVDEFAVTYKKIDSYGKANGHVDQKEFLSYLNDGTYTQNQAEKLATIYGDWSSIPKVTTRGKNKGKWRFD